MIQESDTPPLVVYFDKTGSRKYKSHVIDAAQMPEGIVVERTKRINEKTGKGYVYLGTVEMDEGVVKVWPQEHQASTPSLYWTTNESVTVSKDSMLEALAEIAGAFGEGPYLGFRVSLTEDDLKVENPQGTVLTIGFGGEHPVLQPKTGRGAGVVSGDFCPVVPMILMAVNKKIPNALLFADEGGNEVTLYFKASNTWLVTGVVPLERLRTIAVKLELCLQPIDFAQLPSIGLGF